MRELRPRDRVVELLKTLKEAQEDWGGGGGEGWGGMPSTYNEGSYKELERCLWLMREHAKNLWWHTTMRYRYGVESVVLLPSRKTIKGRVAKAPPCTEVLIWDKWMEGPFIQAKVYTWSTAVEPRYCEAGIDWLIATMYNGDTARIHLPKPFLDRRLGMMEKVTR
jgi:hypothetical protein